MSEYHVPEYSCTVIVIFGRVFDEAKPVDIANVRTSSGTIM